jgi:protein-tyrosine-phosphatase
MAEALFRHLIETNADPFLEKWQIASAGCWAYPGMPATAKAIITVAGVGADLSKHKSRLVSAELLSQYQLILCMEYAHVDFIISQFPEITDKVFLLSQMVGDEYEIDDPVGQSQEAYDRCAQIILSILQQGLERIRSLSSP